MIKKLFLFTFLLTSFLPAFSFQFVTSQPDSLDAENKPASAPRKVILNKALFIKGGLALPQGTFGTPPTRNTTPDDSFNGQDGTGAEKGFQVETGFIFYADSLLVSQKLRTGFQTSLAFSANKLNWTNLHKNYGQEDQTPLAFAGLKVGPVLQYQVDKKLALEAFALVNPGVSNGPNISYSDQILLDFNRPEYRPYTYELKAADDVTFALKYSAGLNLKYAGFLVGLEYNFGNVNYRLKESYTNYTSRFGLMEHRKFEVKTPVTLALVSIGYQF